MPHRIRYRAEFQADLRQQLAWLVENRDSAWIEGLRAAIDEAEDLVSTFPDVGTIEARRETEVMRRLILRKVPYVVWFVRDTGEPDGDVWFMRLFHARQERPPAKIAAPKRRAKR